MTAPGRDILIHRVIACLNVGGPAMHVVLLTREFAGRPIPASLAAGGSEAGASESGGIGCGTATFRVRLVAGSVLETEGDMSYFAEERGVEVTHLERMSRNLSPGDDLRSFFELWRLFRRERPDVVHTHTAKAGALGWLCAALAGVPVRIHTYHGHVLGGDYFSPEKTAFFRGVEKALLILTQRLIVLTDGQREELCARMAVADAEKFAVIPLGLDLGPFVAWREDGGDSADAFAAARARARSALDFEADDTVVGIVGRLVPIKNHELLFASVSPLLDRLTERAPGQGRASDGGRAPGDGSDGSSLRILVVGSGEREEALKAYVRDRGIEEHVRWLGWRRDLQNVYPAMDVLALPSRDEGTPVAVIEALAAGIPVVARDVGGVAEVLEDGKWGKLVGGVEPEAFADALSETLADPPSPETRAAASRSVLERFGLERLVRDLESVYLEELERIR